MKNRFTGCSPAQFLVICCLLFLCNTIPGAQTDPKDKGSSQDRPPDSCVTNGLHFKVQADKTKHPAPKPPAGKAMVYVIQERDFGMIGVGLDGKWIGANRAHSYFFFPVDPGPHHLCSWDSDFLARHFKPLLVSFDAQPGKSYYFLQTRDRKYDSQIDKFVESDPDEAKLLISTYGSATSEIDEH